MPLTSPAHPDPLHITAPASDPSADALLSLSFSDAGHGLRIPLPLVEGPETEAWSTTADAGPPELPPDVFAGEWMAASWQETESESRPLEAVIDAIYTELSGRLRDAPGLQPVKIWHYIPDINAGEGVAERYQRFCEARGPHLERYARLPAATAIGAPAGSAVTIILLAARASVAAMENPRQTPAYQYPRRYAPRGPHFARAALVGSQLFVSGTAAVVGHESRHEGDIVAQLREIRENLAALVGQVQSTGRRVRSRAYQVYVRDPADWARLKPRWHTLFPAANAVRVLQGDISRRELLVEVEALYDVS